jgi:hypothetical protein
VDEAARLGFGDVFLTGGEPFILDEIVDVGRTTLEPELTVTAEGIYWRTL